MSLFFVGTYGGLDYARDQLMRVAGFAEKVGLK